MSRSSSSCRSYDSEDESTDWSVTSNASMADYPSDEPTLFNGEDYEDNDEYSSTFNDLIALSMRLKKQYNLPEATVELERCDKIWETMQLLKKIPMDYSNDCNFVKDSTNWEYDGDNESTNSTAESFLPEDRKNSISYIKYQPVLDNGNTALPNFQLLVKSQKKVHHCAACGKLFSERRAFRKHSATVHGITIPEISKWKKNSISVNKVGRPRTVHLGTQDEDPIDSHKKPSIYTDQHKIKNENNSKSISTNHAFEESDDCTNRMQCPHCNKIYKTFQSMRVHAWTLHGISLSSVESKSKITEDDKKKIPRLTEEENSERRVTRNSFSANSSPVSSLRKHICRTCGVGYTEKRTLRKHALKIHGITIPKVRQFVKKEKLEEKRELKHSPVVVKTEEKPDVMTKIKQESISGISRPRRACTINTSYRECTNEEEEVLDKELLAISKVETTECLLCKKHYVNVHRHLKDYHRIVSPEAVIPLQSLSDFKNEDFVDNSERDDSLSKSPGRKVEPYNINVEPFINKNGERRYRCTLCKFAYSSRSNVKRHHVSRGDDCNRRQEREREKSKLKKELCDPLALTDDEEVSSTIPDSEAIINVDPTTTTPNRIRPEEERRSVIIEPQSKRRKREHSEIREYVAVDCDYTNDDVHKNNEKQNGTALSVNCRRSEAEDKSTNSRDTRDSSDRDSGIGISITIKKRNNSYEVVEKDGGDDEKSKDSVNSKDYDVLSMESLEVLPIDSDNDDRKSHRRDLLQSLNNNEENDAIVDLTGSEDCEDVIIHEIEDNCSRNDKNKSFEYTPMNYGFTKRKDA